MVTGKGVALSLTCGTFEYLLCIDNAVANTYVRLCCRPLLVIGKGAALSQADAALRQLADATGLPFLATAMGRGVVPDGHPGAVNAARSAALRGADVVLIFGARQAGTRPRAIALLGIRTTAWICVCLSAAFLLVVALAAGGTHRIQMQASEAL